MDPVWHKDVQKIWTLYRSKTYRALFWLYLWVFAKCLHAEQRPVSMKPQWFYLQVCWKLSYFCPARASDKKEGLSVEAALSLVVFAAFPTRLANHNLLKYLHRWRRSSAVLTRSEIERSLFPSLPSSGTGIPLFAAVISPPACLPPVLISLPALLPPLPWPANIHAPRVVPLDLHSSPQSFNNPWFPLIWACCFHQTKDVKRSF